MNSFLISVGGGIVSGLIVGLPLYFLGGKQLRREAERLRKLTALVIRGLENSGLAIFNRDGTGEPIGLVLRLSGLSAGMSQMTGTLEVQKDPGPADKSRGTAGGVSVR